MNFNIIACIVPTPVTIVEGNQFINFYIVKCIINFHAFFQGYLNLDKLDSSNFTDKFAFRPSPELVTIFFSLLSLVIRTVPIRTDNFLYIMSWTKLPLHY
jgi:hypothetical protein